MRLARSHNRSPYCINLDLKKCLLHLIKTKENNKVINELLFVLYGIFHMTNTYNFYVLETLH